MIIHSLKNLTEHLLFEAGYSDGDYDVSVLRDSLIESVMEKTVLIAFD